MEKNLMLEQYAVYKKAELNESPYHCLVDTQIDMNPHQINAFHAAVQAVKTGGIVLADEVGLGKTIEAALVLRYMMDSGAKRIMIVLPAMLRKQWEVELNEKFGLKENVRILDRNVINSDYYAFEQWLTKTKKPCIVLVSYAFSSTLMNWFPKVKWDFMIIDEAHNMRNVFHGAKRAKKLYDLSKGIPKVLLTATPLQNSLLDLHGIISFIDERIFGPEAVFKSRYIEGENYADLKSAIAPVLYRTLRKDVKYMSFPKRTCRTVDFKLTKEEAVLYNEVDQFLKRETLYSIPGKRNGLITLVIRKLLASSSFALADTFEKLRDRLKLLMQGTKSENAQKGFDDILGFLDDEYDDSEVEIEDEIPDIRKELIREELWIVGQIIRMASNITENAKITALKRALEEAFSNQRRLGIPEKAVIFTESKRTQKYIIEELKKAGYERDDLLLFNGEMNDPEMQRIYKAWKVKNFGGQDYGRNVEFKHAIVDYFRENSRVLVVTDAGSEGLNLQFCNTVINYDLPWNPQKIEQRIGRCHRYGQQNDVVAINFLNTQIDADRRVYEILDKKFELFDGVFGASDVALGVLESGESFEKLVLEIYQSCNNPPEYKRAFDKLEKKLAAKRDQKARELRNLLIIGSDEAKEAALDHTKAEIDRYLREVEYWHAVDEPEENGGMHFWKARNWGMDVIGSHGTLFLGAFCDSGRQLFPVLLMCDEHGNYVDFEEQEIVSALERADDSDISYFTPNAEEQKLYGRIYDRLIEEMRAKYKASVAPLSLRNRKKIENWIEIRTEQMNLEMAEMRAEIEALNEQAAASNNFNEKLDIRKKADKKRKELETYQQHFQEKVTEIKSEAEASIRAFDRELEIHPALAVNIVLKF